MPDFTKPVHEHGDPDRPGPYPHLGKPVEGQAYYVRFGALPKSGYSANFARGTIESGVSVYEATGRSGHFELHVPEEGEWADADLSDRIQHARDGEETAYVVTGEYRGEGADGEPLLANARIVHEIDPTLLRKRGD